MKRAAFFVLVSMVTACAGSAFGGPIKLKPVSPFKENPFKPLVAAIPDKFKKLLGEPPQAVRDAIAKIGPIEITKIGTIELDLPAESAAYLAGLTYSVLTNDAEGGVMTKVAVEKALKALKIEEVTAVTHPMLGVGVIVPKNSIGKSGSHPIVTVLPDGTVNTGKGVGGNAKTFDYIRETAKSKESKDVTFESDGKVCYIAASLAPGEGNQQVGVYLPDTMKEKKVLITAMFKVMDESDKVFPTIVVDNCASKDRERWTLAESGQYTNGFHSTSFEFTLPKDGWDAKDKSYAVYLRVPPGGRVKIYALSVSVQD